MQRAEAARPHRVALRPDRRLPIDPASAATALLLLPQVRRQVLGEEEDLPQPLLPPRVGHLALLLASGALSGIVVRDDARGRRLLVRGSTCKIEETRDLPPDRKAQERFYIDIDALDLEGWGRLAIYGGAGSDHLTSFLEATRESLAAAAARRLRPRVADISPADVAALPPLVRSPLGMQGPAVVALRYALRKLGRVLVVGEQGCGKTYIALAGAYAAGCRRILVMCPPHLAEKWAREARMTIPGVAAIVCRRPQDLERAREAMNRGRPVVCIVTREAAKLGYEERPATVPLLDPRWRHVPSQGCDCKLDTLDRTRAHLCRCGGRRLVDVARHADGTPARLPACPDCFTPLSRHAGGTLPPRCPRCGTRLLAARAGVGPRRYPLSRYVARRMKGVFQCLIIDEAHEYRSAESLQAAAAMRLAGAIPRVVCLTGTLLGGYASHLYNILFIVSPTFRRRFDRREGGRARFVREYGLTAVEQRPWQARATRQPLPGVSPAVTPWLLERGVYLRLDEVVRLPPLQEEAVLVEPSPELSRAIARLHRLARERLGERGRRLGSDATALMHVLISYPDLAWAGEEVMDGGGALLLRAAPLGDAPFPKEEALVGTVREEVAKGRPCLVYVTYTGSRDVAGRLQRILQEAGIRADVLRADAVPPARREAWLLSRMAQGVQALICQPRLVALGLDLIAFPTIIFYQPDPDPFVVRQAARRSYRIGQQQPVRVLYFAYRGSAQELLLAILARKAAASLLIEGEALGGGLLPLSEGDTLAELARLVAQGVHEDPREHLRRAAEAAAWAARRAGWDGPAPEAVTPPPSSLGVQMSLPGL